ncbi:flagellum-specific ATP synthase FliI [Alsobacter soli]|uniref:Flagellum-specific ATP synthase FliI n=2 Tax=Alsobacter soli TaxID=2109933 RepID=A0A2T1HRF9_9HYPH|nr:flagellum-specific ATP synthase FliI [Alsobacter soli]
MGAIRQIRSNMIFADVGHATIGGLCSIVRPNGARLGLAEVIGFADGVSCLVPLEELPQLASDCGVIRLEEVATAETGASIMGCVVNFRGQITQRLAGGSFGFSRRAPLRAAPPPPDQRRAITDPFPTGVTAIDTMLTCGIGQRMAIMGAAGAGKSSLVAQIVQGSKEADVIVVGLIGERGREVGQFASQLQRLGAAERSIIVASTSDRPAVERLNSALAAITIAEAQRDEGKRVLLIIDSLTRVARAIRELGLAMGEPPARRGFPPSVFSELPKMIERCGSAAYGSITAFFTVLAEGDIETDPIVEEVQSLVDGHIYLSPEVARSGRYPAIDFLKSQSRLMPEFVSPEHLSLARQIRARLAAYQKFELLIRVGEYQPGADQEIDAAIQTFRAVQASFSQDLAEAHDFGASVALAESVLA